MFQTMGRVSAVWQPACKDRLGKAALAYFHMQGTLIRRDRILKEAVA
jgi:hypothetical protein